VTEPHDDATGELGDVERIELCFPALVDLVVLARFTAAAVGTRSGFDIDEIEDLRLAVDELCVSFGPLEEFGNITFEFERSADSVTIACELERSENGTPGSPTGPTRSSWERTSELSTLLLDALVDEHGQESEGDRLRAWMKKRAQA